MINKQLFLSLLLLTGTTLIKCPEEPSMSCLERSRRFAVTAICYPAEKLWFNLVQSKPCQVGPQMSCGRCRSCRNNAYHNRKINASYTTYVTSQS